LFVGMTDLEGINEAKFKIRKFDWFGKIVERMERNLKKLVGIKMNIPKERGKAFHDVCPHDHNRLIFDPFDPKNRRCTKCGRNFESYEYYLSWVRQFHEWLGNRMIEAGIVYALSDEGWKRKEILRFIRDVLNQYSDLYLWYPHQDNELGPGRIFPSTYMESLWIAKLILALDFVAGEIEPQVVERFKLKLFYPAVETILDYDEGMNNRQAMNNYGIGSVGFSFENNFFVDTALNGKHGFLKQIENGVLIDGMWYEGNNYHWPTLEAFILLAEVANANGMKIYNDKHGEILRKMFHVQLDSIMPDGTYPSRKDSEYMVDLGRYSSLYEIAYRRFKDARFGRFLRKVYGRKDRSNNEWYCIFAMDENLPNERFTVDFSINLPGTGMAIFRTPRVYSYIDYGYHGGGHGHPDKLHLTFLLDGGRFFEDLGTCNYLFRELFWYRSTRAHNTIMVDGKNQNLFTTGRLLFYGDMDNFKVVSAQVDPGTAYPDSGFRRTFVLTDVYALDFVECFSENERKFELNWNTCVDLFPRDGGIMKDCSELKDEDGGEFLENVRKMEFTKEKVEFELVDPSDEGRRLSLKILLDEGDALYICDNPGKPFQSSQRGKGRTIVHSKMGKRVRFVSLLFWDLSSMDLNIDEERITILHEGGKDEVKLVFDENFPRFSLKREGRERIFRGYNVEPERIDLYDDVKVERKALKSHTVFEHVENDILLSEKIELPKGFERKNKKIIYRSSGKEKEEGVLGLGGVEDFQRSRIFRITAEGEEDFLELRKPVFLSCFVPNLSGRMLRVDLRNVSPYEVEGVLGLELNDEDELSRECKVRPFGKFTIDIPLTRIVDPMIASVRFRTKYGEIEKRERWRVGFFKKVNEEPKLDGSWEGWDTSQPLKLILKEQVRHGEREWNGPKDLSGLCFLNHDGKNIFVGLRVIDDSLVLFGRWRRIRYFPDDERDLFEKMYDSDSFQIYFDFRNDENQGKDLFTPGAFGFLVAPILGEEKMKVVEICSKSADVEKIEGYWFRREDGYDAFLKIPFDALNLESPDSGDKIGFDLILNDNDGTDRRNQQMVWSGARNGRVWLHQQYHYPSVFGCVFFE